MANQIKMSKGAYLKEHRKLVKTLKGRKKAKLDEEIKEQTEEVKKATGVKI